MFSLPWGFLTGFLARFMEQRRQKFNRRGGIAGNGLGMVHAKKPAPLFGVMPKRRI
jgi:hypothetical protein